MLTIPYLASHNSICQGLTFNLVKSNVGRVKNTRLAFLYLLMLSCSAVFVCCSVNLVDAQLFSTVTITVDGDIEGTNLIQRNGDIYVFTGDIFGSITVKKGGITIDGAGYTLSGNRNSGATGIDLLGYGEVSSDFGNVLIKNLRFYNITYGIYASSNNNRFFNNHFENSGLRLTGDSGSGVGNEVKYNIFTSSIIFVTFNSVGNDVITENDFIDSAIFISTSKPPVVDKNYWSDYTTLYPDAKEKGHSGIWNTPYDYEMVDSSHGNDPCIDYNPLVNPTNGSGAGISSGSFPINILITASIITIVIIIIGLLVYFKKHK